MFDSCMDLLLLVVLTDMSSTVFIEPKPVLEFIHDLLHKDLTRSLTDSDRVKVWRSSMLFSMPNDDDLYTYNNYLCVKVFSCLTHLNLWSSNKLCKIESVTLDCGFPFGWVCTSLWDLDPIFHQRGDLFGRSRRCWRAWRWKLLTVEVCGASSVSQGSPIRLQNIYSK
jgi:hypothetical protein